MMSGVTTIVAKCLLMASLILSSCSLSSSSVIKGPPWLVATVDDSNIRAFRVDETIYAVGVIDKISNQSLACATAANRARGAVSTIVQLSLNREFATMPAYKGRIVFRHIRIVGYWRGSGERLYALAAGEPDYIQSSRKDLSHIPVRAQHWHRAPNTPERVGANCVNFGPVRR